MNIQTEPELITDPDLKVILAELMTREPLFHRPQSGRKQRTFEGTIDADFWEIGASGRRYSRSYVLAVLARRHDDPEPDDPWSAEDFHCRRLSEDTYLLTYTLFQGKRKTRRTTIWRSVSGHWQALFHQGTIVQVD
jgi:hypothetical protein